MTTHPRLPDPAPPAPDECLQLRAPFPWMGGKRRVAQLVWERFGDTPNYCEPFFGSGAVLLGRPHPPKVETVNDADAYLSNFWRALAADPDAVAHWCDWPVNEADLHARHRWLLAQSDFRRRMLTEPDYYDTQVAGWWVWGLCAWIGSGWCHERWWSGDAEAPSQVPHIGNPGRGDARPSQAPADAKRPWLGEGGRGVHRTEGEPWQQRPALHGSNGGGGIGVHRPGLAGGAPSQVPHIRDAGMGVHRPSQQMPEIDHLRGDAAQVDLYGYLNALAARLRRVRVCCGDWTRILGPTPTWHHGLTAVFLDPPYGHHERQADLYAVDRDVAPAVAAWARANGDNPLLRIALCGLDGEHEMPDTWEVVRWQSGGGYGNQGQGRGRENADREVIWFSPHCLKPIRDQQLTFTLGDEP